VPDRYLPILRVGLPITAKPDALPGEMFTGHIAQIDTRIDPATRALKARAEFPNADGRLKPGMLIKVAIDQGAAPGRGRARGRRAVRRQPGLGVPDRQGTRRA
jgi:membrane fusion protein (multidrug efflux system)